MRHDTARDVHVPGAMRLLLLLSVCACGVSPSAPRPLATDAAPEVHQDAAPLPTIDAPVVSFSRDVAPLIDHCGTSMCHGGSGPTWPYAMLVNQPATECDPARVIVVAGSPDDSYLIKKLAAEDMCTGVRMPKDGPPLRDDEIDRISAWIAQGAHDN